MHPAGGGFKGVPVRVVALDDKLQIRGLGDDQVLFQGDRLARADRLAGENVSQRLVRHPDVGIVVLAGVLHRQLQPDGVARGSALLVRGEGNGQVHGAVRDGVRPDLFRVGLAAGLVGDGGFTVEVFGAHLGGEDVFLRFAGGDALDGAGGRRDVLVLLDGHVGHFGRAGVRDFVNDADFLVLPGDSRQEGAADRQLRLRARVGDRQLQPGHLGRQLAGLRILLRALDDKADKAGFQLLLRNVPGAFPAFAVAGGQGGSAEILHRSHVRIIQLHRAGHILIPGVADGDAERKLSRTAEGRVPLRRSLVFQRTGRHCRGGQSQRQHQTQYQTQEKAFLRHLVRRARRPLPPSSAIRHQRNPV